MCLDELANEFSEKMAFGVAILLDADLAHLVELAALVLHVGDLGDDRGAARLPVGERFGELSLVEGEDVPHDDRLADRLALLGLGIPLDALDAQAALEVGEFEVAPVDWS